MAHPRTQLAAALLALAAASGAQAAAELTASLRDPSGTVAANQTIELWLTLENIGDEAFTFDEWADSESNFGLPASFQLPLFGYNYATNTGDVPFDSYDSIGRYTWRGCVGTFDPTCQGGPYEVTTPADSDATWFGMDPVFSLAPGETKDVLLYAFVPVGGVAPAGTYEAYSFGLGVTVYGRDENGASIEATLFEVNPCGESGCVTFSRTVTAVPEPSSVALLLAGLLPVAAGAWKRTRRTQP